MAAHSPTYKGMYDVIDEYLFLREGGADPEAALAGLNTAVDEEAPVVGAARMPVAAVARVPARSIRAPCTHKVAEHPWLGVRDTSHVRPDILKAHLTAMGVDIEDDAAKLQAERAVRIAEIEANESMSRTSTVTLDSNDCVACNLMNIAVEVLRVCERAGAAAQHAVAAPAAAVQEVAPVSLNCAGDGCANATKLVCDSCTTKWCTDCPDVQPELAAVKPAARARAAASASAPGIVVPAPVSHRDGGGSVRAEGGAAAEAGGAAAESVPTAGATAAVERAAAAAATAARREARQRRALDSVREAEAVTAVRAVRLREEAAALAAQRAALVDAQAAASAACSDGVAAAAPGARLTRTAAGEATAKRAEAMAAAGAALKAFDDRHALVVSGQRQRKPLATVRMAGDGDANDADGEGDEAVATKKRARRQKGPAASAGSARLVCVHSSAWLFVSERLLITTYSPQLSRSRC
jgi:hypothetical protein